MQHTLQSTVYSLYSIHMYIALDTTELSPIQTWRHSSRSMSTWTLTGAESVCTCTCTCMCIHLCISHNST